MESFRSVWGEDNPIAECVCVCFMENTIPFVKRVFFYIVEHELSLTALSKVYLSVPHD